jgi:hypothetical protein
MAADLEKGERELRRIVRIAQVTRVNMATALKHKRATMRADVVGKAEAEIRQLDRVIEYGSRALSSLPERAEPAPDGTAGDVRYFGSTRRRAGHEHIAH